MQPTTKLYEPNYFMKLPPKQKLEFILGNPTNKRLAVISEFVSSSGDSAAFESHAKKTGESRNPVVTENMHNAYPIIISLATIIVCGMTRC